VFQIGSHQHCIYERLADGSNSSSVNNLAFVSNWALVFQCQALHKYFYVGGNPRKKLALEITSHYLNFFDT
jgi:hypothetical protein